MYRYPATKELAPDFPLRTRLFTLSALALQRLKVRTFVLALAPAHRMAHECLHLPVLASLPKLSLNRVQSSGIRILTAPFGPGKPLEIVEIDVEPPRKGEVLVKITHTGVCHTDAFTLSGDAPQDLFPAVLGHEGAGIAVEVGEGVTSVKPGDHVILLYIAECGECLFCKSRKTNPCVAVCATQGKGVMPDSTTHFSYNGQPVYHYMGRSTFSEYNVAAEVSLATINQDGNPEQVCLLDCGVTTGLGAVKNTAKVQEGDTVAVLGLGGIGLAMIQGAKLAKVGRIIAIDTNPGKFEPAQAFGATDWSIRRITKSPSSK